MKIVEIFQSIDGEVNGFYQGRLTTFVRTAGCNLNCSYCDTEYANQQVDSKIEEFPEDVLQKVKSIGGNKVTITGGEPLLQKDIWEFIDLLCINQYKISIETNGSCKIPLYYFTKFNISWIIDYKLEYAERMVKDNYLACCKEDWIKFVVRSIEELEIVISIKNILLNFGCKGNFAISPVFNELWGLEKGGVQNIVDYLAKKKEFDFVINLQLHKFINMK